MGESPDRAVDRLNYTLNQEVIPNKNTAVVFTILNTFFFCNLFFVIYASTEMNYFLITYYSEVFKVFYLYLALY